MPSIAPNGKAFYSPSNCIPQTPKSPQHELCLGTPSVPAPHSASPSSAVTPHGPTAILGSIIQAGAPPTMHQDAGTTHQTGHTRKDEQQGASVTTSTDTRKNIPDTLISAVSPSRRKHSRSASSGEESDASDGSERPSRRPRITSPIRHPTISHHTIHRHKWTHCGAMLEFLPGNSNVTTNGPYLVVLRGTPFGSSVTHEMEISFFQCRMASRFRPPPFAPEDGTSWAISFRVVDTSGNDTLVYTVSELFHECMGRIEDVLYQQVEDGLSELAGHCITISPSFWGMGNKLRLEWYLRPTCAWM